MGKIDISHLNLIMDEIKWPSYSDYVDAVYAKNNAAVKAHYNSIKSLAKDDIIEAQRWRKSGWNLSKIILYCSRTLSTIRFYNQYQHYSDMSEYINSTVPPLLSHFNEALSQLEEDNISTYYADAQTVAGPYIEMLNNLMQLAKNKEQAS